MNLRIRIYVMLTAPLLLCLSACNPSQPAPQVPHTTTSIPVQPTPIKLTGAQLYKRCVTCHSLEQDGRHKVGPNLWSIFGSQAGIKPDFNYSRAMKNSDIIWSDETLNAFLAQPITYIPGNRMSFIGIRTPDDRATLISYIKTRTTPPSSP